MTAARIVLLLAGLTLGGTGLAFLIRPEELAAALGIHLTEPLAVSDIRTVYGGLNLALGGGLLRCAASRAHTRIGLILQMIIFGGLSFGRILSFLIDAPLQPLARTLLAIESLGFCLAAACLRIQNRPPRPKNS